MDAQAILKPDGASVEKLWGDVHVGRAGKMMPRVLLGTRWGAQGNVPGLGGLPSTELRSFMERNIRTRLSPPCYETCSLHPAAELARGNHTAFPVLKDAGFCCDRQASLEDGRVVCSQRLCHEGVDARNEVGGE